MDLQPALFKVQLQRFQKHIYAVFFLALRAPASSLDSDTFKPVWTGLVRRQSGPGLLSSSEEGGRFNTLQDNLRRSLVLVHTLLTCTVLIYANDHI